MCGRDWSSDVCSSDLLLPVGLIVYCCSSSTKVGSVTQTLSPPTSSSSHITLLDSTLFDSTLLDSTLLDSTLFDSTLLDSTLFAASVW